MAQQRLGFVEHYRYGDPLSGAQMEAENAWIMLEQSKAGGQTPGELGFGTQSLTVFVEDLEAHFAKAQKPAQRLRKNYMRLCMASCNMRRADLEGHHWLFSRHARDVSPDQWGAVVKRADLSTGAKKYDDKCE